MRGRGWPVLLALAVTACGGGATPAPTPTTIRFGEPSDRTLAGGPYTVTWSTPGCTMLELTWAPTTGDQVVIPVSSPTGGSARLSLPAGPGYLNDVADCDGSVTLAPG